MRARIPSSALVALLAVGCGSGNGGDSVPLAEPAVIGSGSRLATLNDPSAPRPSETAVQLVTGVTVVAVDRFDETHDGKSAGGIFVQDLAREAADGRLEGCARPGVTCPYAGILLFDASFNPPALRVASGDVVDVRGQYQEFAGPASLPFPDGETLPELVGGTVSLRFEYAPLEPITIELGDLVDYAKGRRWLGMLVRLENVRVFDAPYQSANGRYSVRLDPGGGVSLGKVPTLTNALFDVAGSGVSLEKGTTLKSVTGVVQYFQNFSIAPRSASDLVR
ncbi:MAG: hypothetical protein OZ921_20070 [Sorangiineae bacterium]|nr:hypothetical protein [Polyangiaceae bacterium]MEB2324822.1 hypothetical protein [Sorangiineae bacterium]